MPAVRPVVFVWNVEFSSCRAQGELAAPNGAELCRWCWRLLASKSFNRSSNLGKWGKRNYETESICYTPLIERLRKSAAVITDEWVATPFTKKGLPGEPNERPRLFGEGWRQNSRVPHFLIHVMPFNTSQGVTPGTNQLRYVATADIELLAWAHRETSEEEYITFMRSQFGADG
jgi:hypothetical protein